MASHRAKCTALQKCYADFVLAINANPTTLKNELYAKHLITKKVHNGGSADEIASSIEDTLMYDESAWDKLMEVFHHYDGGGIIADKLMDQLRELLRENPPRG